MKLSGATPTEHRRPSENNDSGTNYSNARHVRALDARYSRENCRDDDTRNQYKRARVTHLTTTVENLTRRYLSFSSFSLSPSLSRGLQTLVTEIQHLFHRAGLRLIAKLVSDFHTPALPSSSLFQRPKSPIHDKINLFGGRIRATVGTYSARLISVTDEFH